MGSRGFRPEFSDFHPFKIETVYVNLGQRGDRRAQIEFQLGLHGIKARRFPGVKWKFVRDPWGFQTERRYACSLAKRLALRQGFRSGADAVLLLEDDAVFHPEFRERLGALELPDDWGLLYLGCRHLQRPYPVGPGLLCCAQATDNHAVIVRRDYLHSVLGGLKGSYRGAPRDILFSDLKLSEIHSKIPAYAAYPNLVWQSLGWSDGSARIATNYLSGGGQNIFPEMMVRVDAEIIERGWGEGAPNPAEAQDEIEVQDESLSLKEPPAESGALAEPAQQAPITARKSRGDRSQPPSLDFLRVSGARYQLEAMFPLRRYINLGRRGDRRNIVNSQFESQGLSVMRFPAIDGRSVRNARNHGGANAYACRLSHRCLIREAKAKAAPAVLIFEDDVVLHRDFRIFAEALSPPEDWGIVLFGCTHVETPEVVEPGWVRTKNFWSLHAYAVRDIYYDLVLSALNKEGLPDREEGADVVISRLADQIPTYAVFPNIAWQGEGYSDLMSTNRAPFRKDGHQNRLQHVLLETNYEMRASIIDKFGEIGVQAADEDGVKSWVAPLQPEDVFPKAHRPPHWRIEDVFPQRYCINLRYRVDRLKEAWDQFGGQALEVERWSASHGSGSAADRGLTEGEEGCALSHCGLLEQAEADQASAVLIFEDDVVLHARWREWCEGTALPDDWGMLFFGCQHTKRPQNVVCSGLVRLARATSAHAYAVRAPHCGRVARAMRDGLAKGIPCDVVLAELQMAIPS